MIARQSQLFIPTLREAPADAEAVSHKLLVRGGYIRQVSTGVWTFLPLGWRVHQKVVEIIREEQDAIGGAGDAHARPHPVRVVGGDGQDVDSRALPPRGPHRASLHPPVDARGDRDVSRAGDPELPATAADALPLLGQGSRRAPAARRASPRARVHHEGCVLVRPRRGGPGRELSQAGGGVPQDLPALRPRVLGGRGGVGGDGRQGVDRTSSRRPGRARTRS